MDARLYDKAQEYKENLNKFEKLKLVTNWLYIAIELLDDADDDDEFLNYRECVNDLLTALQTHDELRE